MASDYPLQISLPDYPSRYPYLEGMQGYYGKRKRRKAAHTHRQKHRKAHERDENGRGGQAQRKPRIAPRPRALTPRKWPRLC